MDRNLTDADVAAIAAAITVPHLDPTVHAEQHAFLQAWMAKEQRKQERYEKIKEQVSGWLIIAILGAAGTGAYRLGVYLLHHVRVGQ